MFGVRTPLAEYLAHNKPGSLTRLGSRHYCCCFSNESSRDGPRSHSWKCSNQNSNPDFSTRGATLILVTQGVLKTGCHQIHSNSQLAHDSAWFLAIPVSRAHCIQRKMCKGLNANQRQATWAEDILGASWKQLCLKVKDSEVPQCFKFTDKCLNYSWIASFLATGECRRLIKITKACPFGLKIDTLPSTDE